MAKIIKTGNIVALDTPCPSCNRKTVTRKLVCRNCGRDRSAETEFVEVRSFDYHGVLALKADGSVWYVSDVSNHQVDDYLWSVMR